MLRWEFFILESDVIIICIHFFTLQAWIFDVATDIYQYCDCMSDEKILIAPPDARVEKIKFVCW